MNAPTLLPHQQRVVEEHQQLDERHTKLTGFLASAFFKSLDPAEQRRLERQYLAMSAYLTVLIERIDAFKPA